MSSEHGWRSFYSMWAGLHLVERCESRAYNLSSTQRLYCKTNSNRGNTAYIVRLDTSRLGLETLVPHGFPRSFDSFLPSLASARRLFQIEACSIVVLAIAIIVSRLPRSSVQSGIESRQRSLSTGFSYERLRSAGSVGFSDGMVPACRFFSTCSMKQLLVRLIGVITIFLRFLNLPLPFVGSVITHRKNNVTTCERSLVRSSLPKHFVV